MRQEVPGVGSHVGRVVGVGLGVVGGVGRERFHFEGIGHDHGDSARVWSELSQVRRSSGHYPVTPVPGLLSREERQQQLTDIINKSHGPSVTVSQCHSVTPSSIPVLSVLLSPSVSQMN